MKGQAYSMAHIAYVRVSTAEQNEARKTYWIIVPKGE